MSDKGLGMLFLRHLFAIAILPFTVTILVPVWIARTNHVGAAIGVNALEVLIQVAGVITLVAGLLLFGASLWQFAVHGRGTLAPWDPPRHLVVQGPYRYVRNPMISGVLFVLVGESLLLLSWPHAAWTGVFFCLNATYIPLLEEPLLRGRFGEAYTEYCRHVSRLLPRVTPWVPPANSR
jgi:protein-S-isoprenylcysteine O-methyltransferase Ste14